MTVRAARTGFVLVIVLAASPVPFGRDEFAEAASRRHQQRMSAELSRAVFSAVRNRVFSSVRRRQGFLQEFELRGRYPQILDARIILDETYSAVSASSRDGGR